MKIFILKKSHNAENVEGGPIAIFQHLFCRKPPTKLKAGPFGEFLFEKSHYSKKLQEGPSGIFERPFCRKTS